MPSIEVLLDTTYLLPTFGVRVRGLDDDALVKLRELGSSGEVRYYCSSVIWVELIGKVAREAKARGEDLEDLVVDSARSLLESDFCRWIHPSKEAIKLAYRMRKLGHRDVIDNLLYSMAVTEGMRFLSMDSAFHRFLEEIGFETDVLISHEDLFRLVGSNK